MNSSWDHLNRLSHGRPLVMQGKIFLNKTWRLFIGEDEAMRPFGEAREDVTRALHVAIKETTEGIESLKFNTPISKMMGLSMHAATKCPQRRSIGICSNFGTICTAYCRRALGEIGNSDSLTYAEWRCGMKKLWFSKR